jgi:hypothetical protein
MAFLVGAPADLFYPYVLSSCGTVSALRRCAISPYQLEVAPQHLRSIHFLVMTRFAAFVG